MPCSRFRFPARDAESRWRECDGDDQVSKEGGTRTDELGIGLGRLREFTTKRGHLGTSLVELLVVLALLSVMVIAAAQLVVHSMQLLGATGRAVRNPLVVHVTSRIRHDVQEAAGLKHHEWVWSDEPLTLVNHDGSSVSLALDGGNLVRSKTEGAGSSAENRVILRGVTAWWWRSPVDDVVDVNITYLVNPAPERQVSRAAGHELERRQENFRFAIRGGGGGTRW
jgi:hypothetical protein